MLYCACVVQEWLLFRANEPAVLDGPFWNATCGQFLEDHPHVLLSDRRLEVLTLLRS